MKLTNGYAQHLSSTPLVQVNITWESSAGRVLICSTGISPLRGSLRAVWNKPSSFIVLTGVPLSFQLSSPYKLRAYTYMCLYRSLSRGGLGVAHIVACSFQRTLKLMLLTNGYSLFKVREEDGKQPLHLKPRKTENTSPF